MESIKIIIDFFFDFININFIRHCINFEILQFPETSSYFLEFISEINKTNSGNFNSNKVTMFSNINPEFSNLNEFGTVEKQNCNSSEKTTYIEINQERKNGAKILITTGLGLVVFVFIGGFFMVSTPTVIPVYCLVLKSSGTIIWKLPLNELIVPSFTVLNGIIGYIMSESFYLNLDITIKELSKNLAEDKSIENLNLILQHILNGIQNSELDEDLFIKNVMITAMEYLKYLEASDSCFMESLYTEDKDFTILYQETKYLFYNLRYFQDPKDLKEYYLKVILNISIIVEKYDKTNGIYNLLLRIKNPEYF